MEFLQLSTIEQMKYDDISFKLGVDKKQLSIWWEELKEERGKITKLQTLYNSKGFREISFSEFYKWFQSQKKQCHYCKLTEEEIRMLITHGKITTKRLKTRGRSLELERRDPVLPYDKLNNLVLSCYWCNSSKSDEFTEGEFKPIGIEFGKIWKNRLKTI